jgi:hypothetical protein
MSDRFQIRATWREGFVSPEARMTRERQDAFHKADERLAASGIATFEPGPAPSSDAETIEALRIARVENLMAFFHSDGVDIGGVVPLRVDHVGGAIVEELDIAVAGDQFSVTGWAPFEAFDLLGSFFRCSPGLWIVKARIADKGFGMRYLDVQESVLQEVSAANDPVRDDTTFAVAPPGVRFWKDPSWDDPGIERFTRGDIGVARFARAA